MTTTTASATRRSITTAVRKALRLSGHLPVVVKVGTIDTNTAPINGVQTPVWSTTVETTHRDNREMGKSLTDAGFTVSGVGSDFILVTTPREVEPVTETDSESNTHHVAYTNAAGYSGTVLIERGHARRTAALEQVASTRRSGGYVHSITEITPDGRRVNVELPAPAAEEIAADDYQGDDDALATDLRITEGNLAKAGRHKDLRAGDRRYRVYLLRIQAARAAVGKVVAELAAPDRFEEREALSTLVELAANYRDGIVPTGGEIMPYRVVRAFLALGIVTAHTTPNRGVALTDFGRRIAGRLSGAIRITGADAREIRSHVTRYVPVGATWTEVQVMRECPNGCKLCVRQTGDVLEFGLVHYAGYGCRRGGEVVPVLVG
jgi:hypothetical protein